MCYSHERSFGESQMNVRKYILIFFCATMLVACSSAKKSYEVQSKYVPASRFSHLSCNQLVQEAESLRARSPALAAAVDSHRKSQTNVEIVSWVLFWPAAFWLDDGSQTSSEYAEAKGNLETIQQNLVTKKCSS